MEGKPAPVTSLMVATCLFSGPKIATKKFGWLPMSVRSEVVRSTPSSNTDTVMINRPANRQGLTRATCFSEVKRMTNYTYTTIGPARQYVHQRLQH